MLTFPPAVRIWLALAPADLRKGFDALAESVGMSEGNMGCPHEEGEDFPMGEDCPFCPFWKGKQGSKRRE